MKQYEKMLNTYAENKPEDINIERIRHLN